MDDRRESPGEQVLSGSSLAEAWSERAILAEAEAVAHIGAWAWITDTDRLWWSDETYRIFGVDPRTFEVTSKTFLAHVHPDDRASVEAQTQEALDSGTDYEVTYRVVRPAGDVRHVREHGSVRRASDGTPVRMLGVVQDVTDEVELERERDDALAALRASEEMHRLLAQNAWDVVWTMGLDGRITFVSPSVERVRGITAEEAMAQTIDQIHPPESATRVMEYFGSLYEAIEAGTELPVFRGEQEYYRKDGSIMLGELQVIPQVDDDGRVTQIIGVTRDISERRLFEQELSRLAVTDPLTGVWNRRHGEEMLTADLAQARRYGPPMSVLMLDIDHFKRINDTHGHQAGDLVLIELCRRLGANLRTSDMLARWGGEEFVILMRHCTLTDAVALAHKLRALISDVPFDGVGTVTVSIGAAELHSDDDLASWLHRADLAMYEAKAIGRNSVHPVHS